MLDQDIVKWKIRSRGLVRYVTRILLKGKGLSPNLKSANVYIERRFQQINVIQTYHSRWATFCNFFEKAILMQLNHISHVFEAIRKH